MLIIFNRIESTRRVFEAIRVIKPKYFFLAADGPRTDKIDEKGKCVAIKKWILENIDWKCEVKTLFQEKNLGCGHGPATAISWFFDQVEEGIILEDDCVPEISFFEYCAELLEKYRYDNRISIISGANFDRSGKYKPVNESYFFSVFPFTWGWATWKRSWKNFDHKIQSWDTVNRKHFLSFIFEESEFQLLWQKVFDDIYQRPPSDIWDYQFFFSCFFHRQLSVVPSVNLITNIGHGSDATHTFIAQHEFEEVPSTPINFPLVHPESVERNLDYDVYLQLMNYGKIEKVTILKRIKRFIKKSINYNPGILT